MPQFRARQGWLHAAMFFAAQLALVSSVAAQVAPADRQAFLSSVSSTSTTSIVGGVIITVTVSSSRAGLERYLRHNAVALRHDLTHGAGPTVDDLAQAFGVADRRAFGALLRRRRAKLFELVRDVDAATARQFAELVLADIARAAL